MKVAIFSGGIVTSTFIERLINGLSETDTSILIFGNQNGPKPKFHPNVKMYANPKGIQGHILFVFRFLQSFFVCRNRVIKYHKHFKNWPWTSVSAWHTWQRHLPVIIHLPDVFHLQWVISTSYWIFLKELYGVKFVVSLRGSHLNYSPVLDSTLKDDYLATFPKVDKFHAVSKAIGNLACTYGASQHQINVIYSGLAIDDFEFRRKKFLQSTGVIKIISVGRSHWVKGYRYALDAIKIIIEKGYNIEYTIVGDLLPEQSHQLNQLNLKDKVTIINRLPFSEVKKMMTESHILLLPSVDEGIANVVLEAMALGTLVVSSNCGGMEEVVIEYETGFIFPIRQVDAMASVLEKALTLSTQEYERIVTNARLLVEKQHTLPILIQRMNQLYRLV